MKVALALLLILVGFKLNRAIHLEKLTAKEIDFVVLNYQIVYPRTCGTYYKIYYKETSTERYGSAFIKRTERTQELVQKSYVDGLELTGNKIQSINYCNNNSIQTLKEGMNG
jgi:hypothetical protein